ncbi:hypothetical protein [Kozakia baliensis]|uniref:Uncharacterized protein n=1 Tax=Kozakia baliensis TaxID=153496 RepID=A0A1D8UR66_9PROT|nr:hypothetical protein [Kozakia baliensis]AOX16007.1 hypothetical protein A0U89_01375 [Kozakia baliensis]GBR27186.1 hypothetical protein AA0488_1069 [Kozakia baliensis NRIC 0488]GEL64091.1 hypothetical protein KBA01_13770 [Kozakia baliensis]
MIIQDYNFYCDMPDDTQYLESATPQEGFIERNMIFLLPDRLRKFKKNLYHVRRNTGPSNTYAPIFRVRCLTQSEILPEGYNGPFDVFPFYTHTTKTRARHKDYYVLFIFKDKLSYVKCKSLLNV